LSHRSTLCNRHTASISKKKSLFLRHFCES